MEKQMLLEALETALLKNDSPEMVMYRNKYMQRLEDVKAGKAVLGDDETVDIQKIDDILKILTPLKLDGDVKHLNEQPNSTLIDHQPGHAFH